jgi:hypothetical protein
LNRSSPIADGYLNDCSRTDAPIHSCMQTAFA